MPRIETVVTKGRLKPGELPPEPDKGPVAVEDFRGGPDKIFSFNYQSHLRTRSYDPAEFGQENPQEIFNWGFTDCGLIYTQDMLEMLGEGNMEKGIELVISFLEELRKDTEKLIAYLAKLGTPYSANKKNPLISEIVAFANQKN